VPRSAAFGGDLRLRRVRPKGGGATPIEPKNGANFKGWKEIELLRKAPSVDFRNYLSGGPLDTWHWDRRAADRWRASGLLRQWHQTARVIGTSTFQQPTDFVSSSDAVVPKSFAEEFGGRFSF